MIFRGQRIVCEFTTPHMRVKCVPEVGLSGRRLQTQRHEAYLLFKRHDEEPANQMKDTTTKKLGDNNGRCSEQTNDTFKLTVVCEINYTILFVLSVSTFLLLSGSFGCVVAVAVQVPSPPCIGGGIVFGSAARRLLRLKCWPIQ